MRVVANRQLSPKLSLLTLVTADGGTLPEILPGQFVQVDIPDSKSTFLRRPISICDVTGNDGIVLMVRDAAPVHTRCANAVRTAFSVSCCLWAAAPSPPICQKTAAYCLSVGVSV